MSNTLKEVHSKQQPQPRHDL
jgi:hypothetical protein